MTEFAKLLQMRIDSVAVEKGSQESIRFGTKWAQRFNYFYIGTYADCCSETWFADIVGVSNLLGQEVYGIEILELPQDPQDGRCRQESDEVYGVRLKTKKGDCDIIYRNSSNGYYGGSDVPMDAQIGALKEWDEITDDWQA